MSCATMGEKDTAIFKTQKSEFVGLKAANHTIPD